MENNSITPKRPVTLVLSMGGARGMAHIGVIEELLAQGYEITSLAGSSIAGSSLITPFPHPAARAEADRNIRKNVFLFISHLLLIHF